MNHSGDGCVWDVSALGLFVYDCTMHTHAYTLCYHRVLM